MRLRREAAAMSDGDAFEILGERVVLEHPYLHVTAITARDAEGREFEALRGGGPDIVYALPLWPDDTVTLVRTHRFGLDGPSLEVPGGHVEPGEETLAAAHRELREETGLVAGRVTHLFSCLLSGKVQQRVHFHVARDLVQSEQDLDAGETMRPLRMPLDEAVALAMSGGVALGMSALAVLAVAQSLRGD